MKISENQNFMLEKDLDETLVRLMATGGLTNDPVLQTWATYWYEITPSNFSFIEHFNLKLHF